MNSQLVLQARRHQGRQRAVEIDLRGRAPLDQLALAGDVALLELDVLVGQLHQQGERLVIALEIGEIGAHAVELALRLEHRQPERHRVDLEQFVARRHMLAFLHQDTADLAGNVGRDEHLLGPDIGIVGRDVAAAREEEGQSTGERDQRHDQQEYEPQPRACAFTGREFLRRGRRDVGLWRQLEDRFSHSAAPRPRPVSSGSRRAGSP